MLSLLTYLCVFKVKVLRFVWKWLCVVGFFLWWKRSTKTHKTLIKYHFKHVHDLYYVVSAPIPCTGCIPFGSSSYFFFNDLKEWTKAKVNSSFLSFKYRHDVDNMVLTDYLYMYIHIFAIRTIQWYAIENGYMEHVKVTTTRPKSR